MKRVSNQILLTTLILSFLIFWIPTSYAITAPKIYFDDQEIVFDQAPLIENGRTLVPIRAIGEAAGMQVDYNSTTKTATLTKKECLLKIPRNKENPYVDGKTHIITIAIDEQTAIVDGVTKSLDVPAKNLGGRIYVPLRFVSDAMDMDVIWLDGNKIMINDRLRGSEALDGEKVFPTLTTNSISVFTENNEKLTLGMDVTEMLNSIGSPATIWGAENKSFSINYTYENVNITCCLGKVALIEIYPGGKWKTAAGISIGSQLKDIVKAYSLTDEFVNKRDWIAEGGINLIFSGNKLVNDYKTATHVISFMFADNTDTVRSIQISDKATIHELSGYSE